MESLEDQLKRQREEVLTSLELGINLTENVKLLKGLEANIEQLTYNRGYDEGWKNCNKDGF